MEIYSNSLNAWCTGRLTQVDKINLKIRYAEHKGGVRVKWTDRQSHDVRPVPVEASTTKGMATTPLSQRRDPSVALTDDTMGKPYSIGMDLSKARDRIQSPPSDACDSSEAYHIAFLGAAPLVSQGYKTMPMLPIQKEVAKLTTILRRVKRPIRFCDMIATTSNLSHIKGVGVRVLHYSGHGEKTYLAFEASDSAAMKPISVMSLQEFVSNNHGKIDGFQLAFVSACHSEKLGHAFIKAGVPHVVAITQDEELDDQAATLFETHFYEFLFRGKHSIAAAFKDAKAAVKFAQFQDADKFLLMPEGGDHDVYIFSDLQNQKGTLNILKPIPAALRNNHPAPPDVFYGRNIDCAEIIDLLHAGRLTVIQGVEGVGKSGAARFIVNYIYPRQFFPDGVFYIDASNIRLGAGRFCGNDHGSIYRLVADALGFCTEGHQLQTWKDIMIEFYTRINNMGSYMLFVLDNTHAIDDREHLTNFVAFFLKNTRPSVKIVVTTRTDSSWTMAVSADTAVPQYHKILPFSSGDANYLFTRLQQNTPRYCISDKETPQLFENSAKRCWDNKDAKGSNTFLAPLLGTARVIQVAASIANKDSISTLNELRKRCDRNLFDTSKGVYVMCLGSSDKRYFETVPKAMQDIWAHEFCPTYDDDSTSSLSYTFDHFSRNSLRLFDVEKVLRILKEFYKKQVQQEGKCSRELRDRDVKFLRVKLLKSQNSRVHRLTKRETITLQTFSKFMEWYVGIHFMAIRLGPMWDSQRPRLIYMIDRDSAKDKLKDENVANKTFLLRVSSTQTRALALTYRKDEDRRDKRGNRTSNIKVVSCLIQMSTSDDQNLFTIRVDDPVHSHK